jgi:P27 family predicted phage terminase small subunit
MPRGPKPKPLEVKIAEGNPGRRPLPEPITPSPLREAPEPPAHLNKDGRHFWEVSIPALHELGLLDKVDGPALEMAAVAYQRFHEARRVIAKQGVTARGSQNQIREHPLLATERKAQLTFLRFAEQYGLTSAARARLGIAMLQGQSLAKSLETELGDTEFQPA